MSGSTERISGRYSMHEAEKDIGQHQHHWRVIKCDGSRDVCECSKCGRQESFLCDFDDEYS
jgi:hypothetical protein